MARWRTTSGGVGSWLASWSCRRASSRSPSSTAIRANQLCAADRAAWASVDASAADLHDLHARAHRTIELLATTPTDDFDRLERGRRFYELGARHRADTWFRVALAEASTDAHAARATAHSWLARIAVDYGDFEEARRQLHEASRLPTPPDAVRHLATALLAFGERNPNAALEALRLASHAEPAGDTAHQLAWLTGCTYHELNRDSEAVATLVPLATDGPRHWRARAKQQLEHMAQDAHTHEH